MKSNFIKRKLRILFLIILSSSSFIGLSQDSQHTLMLSQSAYDENNLSLAKLSAERVLFFSNDTLTQSASSLLISKCYFREGRYDSALTFIQRAQNFLSGNNPEYIRLKLLECATLIQVKDYNYCLLQLSSITGKGNINEQRTISLYAGISNLYIGDYKLAKDDFDIICSKDKSHEIEAIFDELSTEKFIHPKTATIASLIIPGLGQCLTGNFKSGLISFGLNSALVLSSIWIYPNYGLLDMLVFDMFFLRYYRGGVIKAGVMAKENIADFKEEQLRKLLATVDSSHP